MVVPPPVVVPEPEFLFLAASSAALRAARIQYQILIIIIFDVELLNWIIQFVHI